MGMIGDDEDRSDTEQSGYRDYRERCNESGRRSYSKDIPVGNPEVNGHDDDEADQYGTFDPCSPTRSGVVWEPKSEEQ